MSFNHKRNKNAQRHKTEKTLSKFTILLHLSHSFKPKIQKFASHIKKPNRMFGISGLSGRGYQDRTGDLTPPRRARYRCAKPR